MASWLALSVLTLIVVSEIRTGPFARIAIGVLGLRDYAGLATLLPGSPAFLLPLAVPALLLWQEGRTLIAGIQGAMRSLPTAARRRGRP